MNLYQPTITGSLKISGSVEITGSLIGSAVTASYATNLTVSGTITAQTLVVQTVTSSVSVITGSTNFGSLLSNTHVFSGSVTMNPGGLFISSSGNVGIGTVTPTTMLNLSSANPVITLTRSDNGTTGAGAINFCATSTVKWQIGTNQAVGNGLEFNTGNQTGNVMYLTTDGNLGVGLNPGVIRMRVQATANDQWIAAFTTTGTNPYGIYVDTSGATSTGYCFAAYTNTNSGFFIKNNGYIGIGATSPGYFLEIAGAGSNLLTINNNASTRYVEMDFKIGGANKVELYWDNTASRWYNHINAGTGAYLSGGAWTSESDARLKDIIEPITNAVDKVNLLNGVIGKYKYEEEGTRRPFLIAQDVEKALPEAVSSSTISKDGEEEYLHVAYTAVIPLLVESIKELKADNDAIRAELAALKS